MDHYNIILYFGILLFLFHILADYTHISILAIILIVIGYMRWYISTVFYIFLMIISVFDILITIFRWFIRANILNNDNDDISDTEKHLLNKKIKENWKGKRKGKGK
jgi:membrane protein implicated in regulation of membrane protease activity